MFPFLVILSVSDDTGIFQAENFRCLSYMDAHSITRERLRYYGMNLNGLLCWHSIIFKAELLLSDMLQYPYV